MTTKSSTMVKQTSLSSTIVTGGAITVGCRDTARKTVLMNASRSRAMYVDCMGTKAATVPPGLCRGPDVPPRA